MKTELQEFTLLKIFGKGTFVGKGRLITYEIAETVRHGVAYKIPDGQTGSYLFDLKTGFSLFWFSGKKNDAQITAALKDFIKANGVTEAAALAVLNEKEILNK